MSTRPLPDFLRDIRDHRLGIVGRGERSFLAIDMDDEKTPFHVYERVVRDTNREQIETFSSSYRYMAFSQRWQADLKFERVERGLEPVLVDEVYANSQEGNEHK